MRLRAIKQGIANRKCWGSQSVPSGKSSFAVSDGRNAEITNSGFGTVFGVVDGKLLAVCDHAGFAPFGFGYRRCPGEQLNIAVFSDLLHKVWADKIEFETARSGQPRQDPRRAVDRRR